MLIGQRLRRLREQKGLSRQEVENRTGLLRVYISRIENGRTIPSLKTLERLATALDVPMHQVFSTGDERPPGAAGAPQQSAEEGIVPDLDEENEPRFRLKVKEILKRTSPASDDAALAFGTLARLFSKL
jgi:transcriptional regulator with XRE-family HTH domain